MFTVECNSDDGGRAKVEGRESAWVLKKPSRRLGGRESLFLERGKWMEDPKLKMRCPLIRIWWVMDAVAGPVAGSSLLACKILQMLTP